VTDRLVPPHVTPPARALNRLAFVAKFVRNPLLVIPQAVYEQDLVRYGGGKALLAWVTAPSFIKTVLLDERDKFQKRAQIRVLGPLLGKGILTSEGPDWKWQRQTSAPMFRPHELMSFVPTFVRAAEDLVAGWRASPPGSVQPIDRDMTRGTFDVISATLLPSAEQGVSQAIERSTGEFQKTGAWSQLYALANLPKWLPQPRQRRNRQAVLALRAAVAAMLRERRASAVVREDLMHSLMHARDPETGQAMNDEQLIDNLLTFYLAGHETTAKALTWTLYLLARAPQWSAALKDEIARVTGGAAVAREHIDRLVLVQQVLKESMRVYPPVPLMTRQAVEDTNLGPHEIKAGTSIVLSIYAIHRHRRRWNDPDAFDPARFAPEKEAAIPRYHYMPFGAGPRICIGMAFAMIEATAMLATMLQHARFAPLDGHEPLPVARVTLLPRGGMPLRVWAE
jgi:cytochrome P450